MLPVSFSISERTILTSTVMHLPQFLSGTMIELRFMQRSHFDGLTIQSINKGEIDMADDRERNQGMKQGTGEGGGQHAPGRNPQDDRSAGGQGGQQGGQHGSQMPGQGSQQGQQPGQRGGSFDPTKGGDGGSYKEGGQNEQNTRR
jgi:hypothetical protein